MTVKSEVQGVVQALFGAYAGGYLAELTAEATANGSAAVAARLVTIQGVILGRDMSDNQTFVDTILNNLGVTSTNGAYEAAAAWAMGELTAGASRADIVSAAVAFLDGIAAGTIVDSKYSAIAEAFAASVEAGIEYSEGDGAEVFGLDALQTAADISAPFNLAAALATMAAAETAKAGFIAAQDLDEDPDTDTTEAQITALISATAAAGNPVKDFNVEYTTTLGATSTVNARNAVFSVARASAEALVLGEEDDVAVAQAAVDALDAAAEIAAYQAAKAADDAEALVLLDAQSDLAAAEAYFYTQANLTHDSLVRTAATGAYTYDNDTTDATVAFGLIVVVDGDLELATGITEADYPGVTALLAATVALEAAEVAKDATALALNTATGDLDDVDATVNGTELGLVTTLATQEQQLATAEVAAADLETAIADVEAAYALNAQLDALDDDIADAVDAINAGEWNAVTLDGAVTATDIAGASGANLVNDVFLFNDKASVVAGFNADGADLIKFSAGQYSLVVVEAADWGVKAAGSSSALEIFVVDDGANTILYVEENAFDGSTVAAQGNTIAITLTGVTGDDFALNSAGYLSVA